MEEVKDDRRRRPAHAVQQGQCFDSRPLALCLECKCCDRSDVIPIVPVYSSRTTARLPARDLPQLIERKPASFSHKRNQGDKVGVFIGVRIPSGPGSDAVFVEYQSHKKSLDVIARHRSRGISLSRYPPCGRPCRGARAAGRWARVRTRRWRTTSRPTSRQAPSARRSAGW